MRTTNLLVVVAACCLLLPSATGCGTAQSYRDAALGPPGTTSLAPTTTTVIADAKGQASEFIVQACEFGILLAETTREMDLTVDEVDYVARLDEAARIRSEAAALCYPPEFPFLADVRTALVNASDCWAEFGRAVEAVRSAEADEMKDCFLDYLRAKKGVHDSLMEFVETATRANSRMKSGDTAPES